MNDRIKDLQKKIGELQDELESLLTSAQEQFHYRVEEGRVFFEETVREYHKRVREPLLQFIKEASLLHIITAPIAYSLVFPILFVDIAVTVFQFICFPIYGMKKVPRSDFIAIDRHHLSYLNVVEKINCVYCGYGNGVAGYFREVAARTEEYWCPIKHARRIKSPHSKYQNFAEYGDADGYRAKINKTNYRKVD
jgi:hypothetical protein